MTHIVKNGTYVVKSMKVNDPLELLAGDIVVGITEMKTVLVLRLISGGGVESPGEETVAKPKKPAKRQSKKKGVTND